MKNIIKYLLIIVVFNSKLLFSQGIATDKTDVRVCPTCNDQAEVHISVNKTTQATNLVLSFNGDSEQGYAYSLDGGFTWTSDEKMPNNALSLCDPSTAFDASGKAYISTLSYSPTAGYFIQSSTDKGLSWSTAKRGVYGCFMDGPYDKEMIVSVDEMQTSSYVNNFYCAWTDFCKFGNYYGFVRINRSTDGGNTFSNALSLTNHYFGQGTNVQTGPNGEVYVCWADYTNGNIPAQKIGFSYSLDGGINYNTSLPFSYLGIRIFEKKNHYFNDTRVNDFPSMAVDKSCGPYRGRIYIAYPEFENSSSTRSVIRVRYSDNNGVNWSNPFLININDPIKQCPNHCYGFQNWFPWIAVDDLTGLVNVVYYSMDVSENSFSTNTYVAYSTNGGENWSNIKVSDEPHIPSAARFEANHNPDGYAGDYIGITSFNGKSFATWSDCRNSITNTTCTDKGGLSQIYVSEINYDLTTLSSSQSDIYVNSPLNITNSKDFHAYNKVECANLNPVTIGNPSNDFSKVEFVAGSEIVLNSGFSTQGSNVDFTAKIVPSIAPCTTPGAVNALFKQNKWDSDGDILKKSIDGLNVFLYPNPAKDLITIGCLNNNYQKVSISISDIKGNFIFKDLIPDVINDEQIRKIIDINMLMAGVYTVLLKINEKNYSFNFIKE